MYLLKASGDFGNGGKNGDISVAFQNAYAALKIDPNGAYIQNKLALLHLQNGNKDSAFFYANKAVKTAPGWACALTTLALIKEAPTTQSEQPRKVVKKPNKPSGSKIHFGGVIGGGLSKPGITERPTTANDTVSVLGVKGKVRFDIGFIGQIGLGNTVSIRPSVLLSIDQSDIDFQARQRTGALVTQTVTIKTTAITVPIPFIFRFSGKNIAPFISAGPTFSYLMQKSDSNSARLPVKKFDVMGDAGFGVDIGIPKAGIIISPEIKYSRGLIDTHESNNTAYSNLITKLNRQGYTFSIYLRKR
jgi:hypothetical protein